MKRHEHGVAGSLMQPGRESGLTAELADSTKYGEKSFLRQILGLNRICSPCGGRGYRLDHGAGDRKIQKRWQCLAGLGAATRLLGKNSGQVALDVARTPFCTPRAFDAKNYAVRLIASSAGSSSRRSNRGPEKDIQKTGRSCDSSLSARL